MGERKRRHFETIGVDPTAPDRTEVQFRDESPHPGPTEAPGIDIRDGVGAEAGPPGVGDLLRGCRQAQGYDLADVAAALRIRHAYLQAIEDGRFKDLPGATYAAGFLRTYAEFLDIDPQEVVRRFKDEVSGAMPRTELYLPRPVPEGRAPGGAVLL